MTQVLDRAASVATHCQEDPNWFVEHVLGQYAWSKQRAIMESVRDHRKTAIRSGHGVGKTRSAAYVALWFLYAFPGSRVVSTATKWSQVRNLLWHEINHLHAASRAALGGKCGLTRLDLDDGRYAIGLSTRPGQEESFAGHHAKHILLLFDEASGIPQAIYDVGEGYMTTPGARWLMIGNPTRPEGEFYSAFHSKRHEYNCLHISALDSPAITGEKVPQELLDKLTGPEWVEERRRTWRPGSILWDVRVLGEFAKQADDAVIALATIEDAQARELTAKKGEPAVLGVDVARFGSDETVIAERWGRRVRILESYVGKATTETAGYVFDRVRWHRHERQIEPRVVVDDPGVGGGVTDILVERGVDVEPFNGGEQAIEDDLYPNRRCEQWFVGGEQLEKADLDDDEQLAADLLSPRYKLDSHGRRVVEPKAETKKRLGRSPDRADAVLLTFAAETSHPMEVW